jgi:hypothetical protein
VLAVVLNFAPHGSGTGNLQSRLHFLMARFSMLYYPELPEREKKMQPHFAASCPTERMGFETPQQAGGTYDTPY